MKRRLGSAWLEPGEDGKYRKRRGRPKPGFLQEVAAIVAKDRVIRTVERELADAANEAARAAEALPTFREVQKADQLGGSSIARNCSPAPWE